MAFTGNATVKALGRLVARITGISLAGGASGTIRLPGGGGDVSLPADFPSAPDDSSLTLSDLVEVSYVNAAPGGGAESRHIHVEKSENPFTITVTNDAGGNPTAAFEIYVKYHHSMTR